MANTFNYTYKPMNYQQAQKQAAGQIDPLFNRAIQGVNQQKYQNDVQAGQVAAARGLGHSGLAADQLNKIAIAAQGQVGDLNAQRATQLAQMANDLVQQDKQYSLQNRSQLYNEFSNNRNFGYQQGRDKIADTRYTQETAYNHGRDTVADNQWNKQFNYTKGVDTRNYNYQVGRDKVADNQWNTQFNYNKGVDTRNYNYQVGRDKVGDSQWQKQYDYTDKTDTRNYNYQKSQDKLANKWKTKEWNQMSPAEKAQMALQYSYSKKLSKGRGGGGGSSGGSSSFLQGLSASDAQKIMDALKAYGKAKKGSSQSALDKYYSTPAVKAVEKAKKTNKDVKKYFNSPTPPAQSQYLSPWAKMKMFGQ